MLLLPSGRVVDLSTDRAKYHALRNHGPEPTAPHRALYPLVDVIYRRRDGQGNPRRGWTEYDYEFSGYTLGNIEQAPDWSDADITALLKWVGRDDQRRRIETTRRRLVENQCQLSVKTNSSTAYLYSLLQQRLQAMSLQRATVTQWQATVNNLRNRGVREEEIVWSGLQAFFAQQDPDAVLDKSQVLAALDFSNTRLELTTEQIWGASGGLNFQEVALRMPHQVVYRAALKLDDSCHCILRYVDSVCNYRVGVVKTLADGHPLALNKCWFALDSYGRSISQKAGDSRFYASSVAAMAAADAHARRTLGLKGGAGFHTHFDHLTLYGGIEYREWIVSLPDYQRIFFGAHHFDHNVLAHIRTTKRRDIHGRRLLFVEEVQSDWHQSGQRDGYDNNYWGAVANAPFKKEWLALAMKLMLIRASQNGFDGVAWPSGAIQESRYGKSLAAIKRHYDIEIPDALNRLGKPFQCQVSRACIETRDPWLNLEKSHNKWRVADNQGKFRTRDRYHSRDEAMAVLARHCRSIQLEVPVFLINDALRWQIAEKGLPLYGETLE